MRSRIALGMLLAGTALVTGGCGGGGSGGGESASETLPFDAEERCDGTEGTGCLGEPAAAGTTFVDEQEDESWKITYVDGSATREPNDDPANPESLQVVLTLRYEYESDDGEGRSLVGSYYGDTFEVDTSTDGDGIADCGTEPDEVDIESGGSIEVKYCFAAAGPHDLIAGPLVSQVSGSGGGAFLSVEDPPPADGSDGSEN
ncbi:MAG: hypothetical protein H6533_08140 [Thermoleophilales bacterium]|nr:hypothetical protein [Thermoleophilales bacterium]